MSLSLREQLLAAGLVDKKKVEQAEAEQRQQQRRETKGQAPRGEAQRKRELAAAQAQAAKAERDRELARQRQEALERRERALAIKQLIAEHRLPTVESEERFNFIDRGKVRRMSVDAARRGQIMRGELVIVRYEGRYDLVLPTIAERIRAHDPRVIVALDAAQDASAAPAEDDPYKDHVVPDDLMW